MNGAALSSCYGRIVIASSTLGRLVTWAWKIIFISSIILGYIVKHRGAPGYVKAENPNSHIVHYWRNVNEGLQVQEENT